MSQPKRYYSHRVVKNHFGIKERVVNKTIPILHSFQRSGTPTTVLKHMDYLLSLGYNLQYTITQ